jgi:hypothetical protein
MSPQQIAAGEEKKEMGTTSQMEMTHHIDINKTTAIPQSGALKGSILRIRKAWKDSF